MPPIFILNSAIEDRNAGLANAVANAICDNMQVYNDPDAAPEKPPIFRKGYPTVVLALTGLIVAVSLIQFNAPIDLYQWIMASAMLVITPGDAGFARS